MQTDTLTNRKSSAWPPLARPHTDDDGDADDDVDMLMTMMIMMMMRMRIMMKTMMMTMTMMDDDDDDYDDVDAYSLYNAILMTRRLLIKRKAMLPHNPYWTMTNRAQLVRLMTRNWMDMMLMTKHQSSLEFDQSMPFTSFVMSG